MKYTLLLAFLIIASSANALTLTIDHRECGIVTCETYYRLTNDGKADETIDSNRLTLSMVKEMTGYLTDIAITVYNGTGYSPFSEALTEPILDRNNNMISPVLIDRNTGIMSKSAIMSITEKLDVNTEELQTMDGSTIAQRQETTISTTKTGSIAVIEEPPLPVEEVTDEISPSMSDGFIFTVKVGSAALIKVTGKIQPSYDGEEATYSIDHIPQVDGIDYGEYDLWNQTWGKCIDVNITYNLGTYTMINETFPQRVFLNNSNINLSAIRSDWGDLRFTKGTCGNVSTDYSYNLVYGNSTNAETIVYLNAGDIKNNTPTQMAIYYNNSAITHVEPGSNSISWGNGGAINVRIWTNDKSNDNGSSYNSLNDTIGNTLNTFGISNLITYNLLGKERQLSNSSFLYANLPENNDDLSGYRGFGTAFRFRLYNSINAPGTYYLWSIGNVTDTMKTNILRAYVVIT